MASHNKNILKAVRFSEADNKRLMEIVKNEKCGTASEAIRLSLKFMSAGWRRNKGAPIG